MRLKTIVIVLWTAVVALTGALLGWAASQPDYSRQHLLAKYVLPAWHTWLAAVLNPAYWAFVVALAVLQWLWPAEPNQRRPSVAVAQDAAWFLLATAVQVTVVAAFLALLAAGYEQATDRWQVDLTPMLGIWGVAILAFVITDCLAWFSHWLHHNNRTLWLFHAVHHSQENLNALSDNRQHVIETMVAGALSYFPAVLLGLTTPQAIKLAFVTIYFSAFIHSNIRTNLGPLRYVFVSPQAHRVHHSIHRHHYDSNYATIFAFWDYLFGTRNPDDSSYPATGIEDTEFPHGATLNPASLVALWIRQMLYPFKLLADRIVAYARAKRARIEASSLVAERNGE